MVIFTKISEDVLKLHVFIESLYACGVFKR